MGMGMKAAIKGMLPRGVLNAYRKAHAKAFDFYATKSYSQEGEDLVLARIFAERPQGFYVDVGAHHPRRFSNTYLFYRRGWRGINIEPNPEMTEHFRLERPRDIHLQLGIAGQDGELEYFHFDNAALNSFDRRLSEERAATTHYKLLRIEKVATRRLDDVLRQHLPPGTKIDFLSVDVEGLDLEVLQSNDWTAFRPTCVLVESLSDSVEMDMDSELTRLMRSHGYRLLGKTVYTLIFMLQGVAAAPLERSSEVTASDTHSSEEPQLSSAS